MEKKAWFPRVNEDFIAKYQMSYGSELPKEDDNKAADASNPSTNKTDTTGDQQYDYSSIPQPPHDVNDPAYTEWYQKYGDVINSDGYRRWYEYYYGAGRTEASENETSETDRQPPQASKVTDNPDEESYWENLKTEAAIDAASGNTTVKDQAADESESDAKADGKKKAKVKPPAKPASWFEMDDEKNTSVYVSNLPLSTSLDELKDLANKCGLIAFDPITRKPKLKLYKDKEGNFKGDALVSYIKMESVELALDILDGYVIDGCTLRVERARFELKGNFDPAKRKRKLTNKEKKAFREKQAKLFEWRPDKGRFARSRNEKTVIVKNVFTLEEVDTNLLLVNELETDMRSECAKYGDVKKVKVYERNPEGVVGVTFAEAEEADTCRDALNGRWFACRQLRAEAWDGKTKYFVEETEEEYKARLKKWEDFLEGKSPNSSGDAVLPPKPVRQNTDSEVPVQTDQKPAANTS